MKILTKEEVIELLSKPENEVTELNLDKAYIVRVEVGDLPKEQVAHLLINIKDRLSDLGVKDTLLIPSYNGVNDVSFIEVKE